jgi:hypothetical protein
MKTLYLNSDKITKNGTSNYIRDARLTEIISWIVICSILAGNRHFRNHAMSFFELQEQRDVTTALSLSHRHS